MTGRPTPTADPTMTRSIARWIRGVDAATFDARVLDKAKLCLLDMIGVVVWPAPLARD